jgi:hypothetical protein
MSGNDVFYIDFGASGAPSLHRFSVVTHADVIISLSPAPGYLGDVTAAPDGTLYVSGWSIYVASLGGYFGGVYSVAPNATSGGLFWTSSGYNNGPSGVAADDTYVYGAFPSANVVNRLRRDNASLGTIPGTEGVGITDVASTKSSLFFITSAGHLFRLAK